MIHKQNKLMTFYIVSNPYNYIPYTALFHYVSSHPLNAQMHFANGTGKLYLLSALQCLHRHTHPISIKLTNQEMLTDYNALHIL